MNLEPAISQWLYAAPALILALVIVSAFMLRKMLHDRGRAVAKRARRNFLVARYGPYGASRVLAKSIWLGMGSMEVIDTYGEPVQVDESLAISRERRVFHYGRRDGDSYESSIVLVRDKVVAWSMR